MTTDTTNAASHWSRSSLGADQGHLVTSPTAVLAIAGQGPLDSQGRLVHEDDIAAQLALTLANLAEVLTDGGMRWSDVVRLTVYTTDLGALLDVYDTLVDHLATVGAHPPSTVIEVSRLLLPGMAVCIDGLAVR